MRTVLLALGLLAPLVPAQQLDTKRAADALMRTIREQQNEDGSYGEGVLDTCRVLDLMRRSPRHYTELDGPFFRRAAQWLLAKPPVGASEEAAWRVLALADTLTGSLKTARDEAAERLLAADDWADTEAGCRAVRTLSPPDLEWPAATDGSGSAMHCLLAADPSTVAGPGLADVPQWVRWARAARLRGIRPALWPAARPDLLDPERLAGADLATLCDDLDFVIAIHKLADASPLPERELPDFVARPRERREALERALIWLDEHQQAGTFGLGVPGWEGPEPGVTALCLSAAMHVADELGRPRPEWVGQGLDYLVGLQRPTGAIFEYGVAVYTTSVALEALLDGGRPADEQVVRAALDFLLAAQADEAEGYTSADDPHYGGIGYGGDERPDLSNTQMALEAAARTGLLAPDHPFFHKALVFLERNQNLGEVTTREWPRAGGGRLVSGTDGGATYMPGNSPAGEDEIAEGTYRARSYGSMTYALTKSYLLCGLRPDDARVEAAVRWIVDNYTLARNPGFDDPEGGFDGLYYYYMAMGRSLALLPAESLSAAAAGTPPPWRRDLTARLLRSQRVDGTWINARSPRWYEGSPTLCTAYALLALKAAGAAVDS